MDYFIDDKHSMLSFKFVWILMTQKTVHTLETPCYVNFREIKKNK